MKITNILSAGALSALCLANTACSEDTMDRINKDNRHPQAEVVEPKFQVTDAIVASVFTVNTGSLCWYTSIYTEQTFGTGNNQAMNAEMRNVNEVAAAATHDNEWNGAYQNLNNIKQMMEKCTDGKNDIKGVGEVLYAYNWGIMTDLFGDIPFTEALTEGISAPKLDSQKQIYDSIYVYLDRAVADLNTAIKNGDSNMGSQDVLYSNNNEKWLGLAYALKARYLLHTLGRAEDKATRLTEVIAACDSALAKGFEGADLDIFTGYDNGSTNAWSAYWYSRDYIGATTTVDDILMYREHPIETYYNCNFAEYYGKEGELATPGDKNLAEATYSCTLPYWLYQGVVGQVASHLMSISELYFIKAECLARQGKTADDATLKAAFEAGINAAMNDLFKSCGTTYDASYTPTYLAGGTGEKFKENPLSEILVQKYIAQTRDEQLETYCDMRRCRYIDGSYPVAMTNPNNTVNGNNRWPLRLPYGSSDVLSNPNVKAAFGSGNDAGMYIYTENVWWAGGTK